MWWLADLFGGVVLLLFLWLMLWDSAVCGKSYPPREDDQ